MQLRRRFAGRGSLSRQVRMGAELQAVFAGLPVQPAYLPGWGGGGTLSNLHTSTLHSPRWVPRELLLPGGGTFTSSLRGLDGVGGPGLWPVRLHVLIELSALCCGNLGRKGALFGGGCCVGKEKDGMALLILSLPFTALFPRCAVLTT